jgi:hypothetical protein
MITLAVAVAHCGGDFGGLGRLSGDLQTEPVIDFGDVQVGVLAQKDVVVTNKGTGVLQVTSVTVAASFNATAYAFTITQDPFNLAPNAMTTLKATFQAVQDMPMAAESSFTFVTDVPDDKNPKIYKTISVTVRGRGVKNGLQVEPNPIDFGTVLSGSSKTLDIKITNLLSAPVDVTTNLTPTGKADIPNTAGSGHFEIVSMISPEGSLLNGAGPLAQNDSITVTAQYTPDPSQSGRQDMGTWTLSNCPDPLCSMPVTMLGKGTDTAIVCMPAAVDFGDVNPGRTIAQTVTCTNVASDAIQATGWMLENGSASEFSVAPFGGMPIMLNPNDSFTVKPEFSPTLATLHSGVRPTGTLIISAKNPRNGQNLNPTHIALTGNAGGPTISVAPALLDFGQVAVMTSERKHLLVSNNGYAPLKVSMIMSGDPEFVTHTGMLTLQTGTSSIVDVRFTPAMAGVVNSMLVITNNDTGSPMLQVPLRGEGVDLPPCSYMLMPNNVNFGVNPVGTMMTLGVSIQNTGNNPCLVNDLAASSTLTPDPFALGAGNTVTTGIMIPAGGMHSVEVQFSPHQNGPMHGGLTFYISDPNNSNPVVPLFGIGLEQLGVTCPADQTTPAGTPVPINVTATSMGGNITSINWSVTNGPQGGIGTPGQWNPDPPMGMSEQFLPYIVGSYTIHVVVTDSNNNTASCDTHVTAEGHGLRVELTWDGTGDCDLHFHDQNMTPWFQNDDCYYSNRSPQWDAANPIATADNPQLDFDNTVSFGPENTRLDTPALGTVYTIAVHNYRACNDHATIQIFCGGGTMPVQTFVSNLLTGGSAGNCNDGSFWKVATVVFNSPAVCAVTPIDTYTTGTDACSTF